MIEDEQSVRFDWRRGGAAAVGLLLALVLVAMVFAVKFANDARERALSAERQANQVAVVVRNVSANISRWNGSLSRLLNGYSNGTPYPTVNYIHEVVGN